MKKKILLPIILSTIILISIVIILNINQSSLSPNTIETTSPSENSSGSNVINKDTTLSTGTTDATADNIALSESQKKDLDNNVTSILDSLDSAINSLDSIDALNLDELN